MYVLALCNRGFEHFQETTVGCKLLICYIMSHFISEHEQNFEGKGATGRSVLEVLLIQVCLLLREKK